MNQMVLSALYSGSAMGEPKAPSGIAILLTIVFFLVCVGSVILVLMQRSKSEGLGAISGAAETYWGKNKARSNEGMLVRLTTIGLVLFFVVGLLLNMVS